MNEAIPPVAAAPAQPAAGSAPVESDFSAFEREETARDLDRAAGKPVEAKSAPAAAPALVGDDAPAVDATGKPVAGPDGKPISRRQQAANERIREAVERGTETFRTRADALERELNELKARAQPAQPAKQEPVAQPAEDKEPTLDDFMDQPDPYLALQKAAVKWEIAQIRKAEAAERAQTERQRGADQQAEQLFNSYQEREAAFKATVPDFNAKTETLRHALNMHSPLTRAMLESPVAPQLILHLAEHPDDFDRIGRLGATHPAAALRELGKLEAKYETSAAAEPAPAVPAARHVTKAPAPGTFLGSQPAPAADPSKAAVARGDFSAFDEEEIAKDLARAGRR